MLNITINIFYFIKEEMKLKTIKKYLNEKTIFVIWTAIFYGFIISMLRKYFINYVNYSEIEVEILAMLIITAIFVAFLSTLAYMKAFNLSKNFYIYFGFLEWGLLSTMFVYFTQRDALYFKLLMEITVIGFIFSIILYFIKKDETE